MSIMPIQRIATLSTVDLKNITPRPDLEALPPAAFVVLRVTQDIVMAAKCQCALQVRKEETFLSEKATTHVLSSTLVLPARLSTAAAEMRGRRAGRRVLRAFFDNILVLCVISVGVNLTSRLEEGLLDLYRR